MSEKLPGDDFNCVYHEIRDAVAEIGLQEYGIDDAFDWLNKVLEYNVNTGGNTRGRLVATSLQALVSSPLQSHVKIAYILGWCLEMDIAVNTSIFQLYVDFLARLGSVVCHCFLSGRLTYFLQAYFEVSYDFISQRSYNHRRRECWHKKDGIGILSINDAVFIESAMYYVIRRFTRDKAYYCPVMELFREATVHKIVGQRIELNMYSDGKLDWNSFTVRAYESITVYTQAFYSTYLPAACAMYMAGITDEVSHSEAKKVLLEIGQLMQIQEDYNNCFSEISTSGAVDGHRQDKACTWLAAQAAELASDQQKEELQACYSDGSDLAVTKMRDIYRCLGLQAAYRFLKEERLQKIAQMIQSCKGRKMESMFVSILENILVKEL